MARRGNAETTFQQYQEGLKLYRKKMSISDIAKKLDLSPSMVNRYRKQGVATANLASWDHVLKREVMYAQAEAGIIKTEAGHTNDTGQLLSRLESPEFIDIVNKENVSVMVQEALVLQNLREGVEALSSSAVQLVGLARRLVSQAEKEATCLLDEMQRENDAALESGTPLPAGTHHRRIGFIMSTLERATAFLEKTTSMNQSILQSQRLHAGQPTEIVGHVTSKVADHETSIDTLERMTAALKRLKANHIIDATPDREEASE